MKETKTLITDRLILRQWKNSDYPIFASINADPDVMEFLPKILSEDESNIMAFTFAGLIEKHGWGCWAVELKRNSQFIGFTGLHSTSYEIPHAPFVEIGWRFAKEFWGNGYASEAAKASLQFGFQELNLDKIFSFTSLMNVKSMNVMKRLGMTDLNQDFMHPALPAGHKLSEHCLYRIYNHEFF